MYIVLVAVLKKPALKPSRAYIVRSDTVYEYGRNQMVFDSELSIDMPQPLTSTSEPMTFKTYISSWPESREYLCEFWFKSLRFSGAVVFTRSLRPSLPDLDL